MTHQFIHFRLWIECGFLTQGNKAQKKQVNGDGYVINIKGVSLYADSVYMNVWSLI